MDCEHDKLNVGFVGHTNPDPDADCEDCLLCDLQNIIAGTRAAKVPPQIVVNTFIAALASVVAEDAGNTAEAMEGAVAFVSHQCDMLATAMAQHQAPDVTH